MILVPFTHTSVLKNKKMIHTVRLLLEGGQRFWQEEQPVSTVLELNELVATHQFTEDDRHYVHIDSTKTAMDSMYDWRECALDSDTLCWRTYHVILDGDHPWITVSDPLLNRVLVPILKADHITR
jgi:hypothetical protein